MSSSTSQALFYIAIWITASCSMIMFNKAVLSSYDFPYPIFLTTWHMVLSTILTQILSRTTDLLPGVKEGKIDTNVIKTKIFPVALLFAISLICANKAYLFLSVSYIQMLKASTPVAVLGLSLLLRIENSSYIELNIVSLISLGVALASVGELMFSWTGFTFQVFAIVAEASRLVLTGMILKRYKLDSLSTLYYVAPLCACINGFCCFYFESESLPWDRILSGDFLGMLLVNGIVAFSLNIATVMLISHTSALTLTLAGIVKDILLVVLSMAIFRAPVTLLQFLGYSVALLALNLHKEYKKSAALFEGPPKVTNTSNSENENTNNKA
mmetsp:Transcript_3786/g.4166  ORF Transcript_3786/g.4166 Transcript_3786/m.4166 type:complete len:327 (+) Transcript_3786:86-1066(+)